MRILCLGAGAIGGYFCGRLVEADAADVTFLVRPARQAQLARDGLRLESPLGDFKVKVKTVLAGEITAPFDLVLITAKAYDLDSAIDAIRPAVGPATGIVPLLNGLSHMDRLNAEFGRERVLGGIAKISITLKPDGTIAHLNDWQQIIFGEQDGRMSERVVALGHAFKRAKAVNVDATATIEHQMWEKLVHLATIAGMTTLFRANIGEIARAPDGIAIMQEFLDRNIDIAGKCGHQMGEAFVTQYRRMFANPNGTYAASMLRDIERQGPVEADHIIGFMLDQARAHGVDDRLHTIVFAGLKAYENRRAAGRLG